MTVSRRALLAIAATVGAAPVFAWAAAAVGYTEPLAVAAAAVGAGDAATHAGPTLLADYAVPGVPTPVGTLLTGVLGVAVTYALATAVGRYVTTEADP